VKSEVLLPVYGVIGLIALWYVAVWIRVVDPVLLPPPEAAAKALWKGMGGRLAFDFWRTVERTAYATAIAAAAAIPLGVFLGASERVYRACEFVIDFFRSTPASAMFPLFLVIFGVGDTTKILVAGCRSRSSSWWWPRCSSARWTASATASTSRSSFSPCPRCTPPSSPAR
jgi:ABC-type nitrate/sulfonate/bicarbonate transport system permease component